MPTICVTGVRCPPDAERNGSFERDFSASSVDRIITRRPNLFLIGAMKSGTSYLRKLLGSHPSIFMCEPDEPSYFVDPRQLRTLWPEMWDKGIWRSEEHYLRLFQSAGGAPIVGEASTNYTKRPMVSGVPERIQAFNTEARFIYLMRDPVERTISHYWHMVRYHSAPRSIATAMKRDSQYLDVSYYAMQLLPFFERFGRDRVAVLTHEQLIGNPVETMHFLYRWLGVSTAAADVSRFGEAEHVTPEVIKMPLWGGIPRQLWQSSALRGFARHFPQAIKATLSGLTNMNVCRRSVDTADVTKFLQPIQRKQTEELMALLGREFPEWTTLSGQCHQAS
jgi:hypothetical protein